MEPFLREIVPMSTPRLLLSPVHSLPAAIIALILWLTIQHKRARSWRTTPKAIPWITDEVSPTEHRKLSVTSIESLPIASNIKHLAGHTRDKSEGVDLVSAGYDKFSKNNAPFVNPSFIDWHGEVVLPPAHIPWLAKQPEHVLSIEQSIAESTQFRWTSPASYEFSKPFHVEAINKIRIESCISELQDEIETTIDTLWGKDTENWTTIGLKRSMQQILVQANARIFYGNTLTRDDEFMTNAGAFISSIATTATRISLIPEILKPLLARFETRRLHQWNRACVEAIQPEVEKTLLTTAPDDNNHDQPPRTLLETLTRLAGKSQTPIDRDPFNISSRLLAAHYVAVHTSSHTAVNALLDILSPPAQAKGLPEAILTEIQTLSHAKATDPWTKTSVSQLIILDSAIRESMRLHPFKAKSLNRVVSHPEGVTIPSGHHLPRGTKVGVPSLAVHVDGENYGETAKVYDGFRFCRDGKNCDGGGITTTTATNMMTASSAEGKSEAKGMVNPSETFLAFGLGRHACPGRHLATVQLKIILAYVLDRYVIRGLEGGRPENRSFSDFLVTMPVQIEVRRRSE